MFQSDGGLALLVEFLRRGCNEWIGGEKSTSRTVSHRRTRNEAKSAAVKISPKRPENRGGCESFSSAAPPVVSIVAARLVYASPPSPDASLRPKDCAPSQVSLIEVKGRSQAPAQLRLRHWNSAPKRGVGRSHFKICEISSLLSSPQGRGSCACGFVSEGLWRSLVSLPTQVNVAFP
jgi:hypothetical protein